MRAAIVSDFIVADHWPQADILEPLINVRYRGKADIALVCRLLARTGHLIIRLPAQFAAPY
jgi:hypothetical protein